MEKYPFLAKDDIRLTMTDKEIIRRDIDLKNSRLSTVGKAKLMQVMRQNKEALSLHDEVGNCKDSKSVSRSRMIQDFSSDHFVSLFKKRR